MASANSANLAPVLYLPHGGGPLPLLEDPSHSELAGFLNRIVPQLGKPDAIVVVSAHWEAALATVTSAQHPALIYDYYGFPEQAYRITYPAPGCPDLANTIERLLTAASIEVDLDGQRGFDHGVYVPLKIMFPNAEIPCVQLSLLHNLQAQAHIELGLALAALRQQNIVVIGSGFSFHNMSAFFSADGKADTFNDAFQDWLIATATDPALSAPERSRRLSHWTEAPFARYCHPREEHLLPLHVCAGVAGCEPATLVFDGKVAGKRACALLW